MAAKADEPMSGDRKGAALGRIFKPIVIFMVTLAVGLGAGEALLRFKTADQKNYLVETWRYANLLTRRTPDATLPHVHKEGASALIQNVTFRINRQGLRGEDIDLKETDRTKVLVIGGSTAVGWGVEEDQSIAGNLTRLLGDGFRVFNGGVANYNAVRAGELYLRRLRFVLKPDVILLVLSINGGRRLDPQPENMILRNSQLAMMAFYISRIGKNSEDDVLDSYKAAYSPGSPDMKEFGAVLDRLAQAAREDGTRVLVALVPDVKSLDNYPFGFVHDAMRGLAERRGLQVLDFQETFKRFDPKSLSSIPGDPHPNGRALAAISEALAEAVRRPRDERNAGREHRQ